MMVDKVSNMICLVENSSIFLRIPVRSPTEDSKKGKNSSSLNSKSSTRAHRERVKDEIRQSMPRKSQWEGGRMEEWKNGRMEGYNFLS